MFNKGLEIIYGFDFVPWLVVIVWVGGGSVNGDWGGEGVITGDGFQRSCADLTNSFHSPIVECI